MRVSSLLGVMIIMTLLCRPAFAAKELTAIRCKDVITIDGQAGDPCWSKAKPVVVRDSVAQIDITLKAVHDGQSIFLLATFPDKDESRQHRELVWNEAKKVYLDGPTREDLLEVHFNMSPYPSGLSLKEEKPYRADVWFWKACRTDPAGYADDKYHDYSDKPIADATPIVTPSGRIFYLARMADEGKPAYEAALYPGKQQERMPRFISRKPEGSRADVRAKGIWSKGEWTVEFGRLLNTGHADDIAMSPGGKYCMAVSRFETAGRQLEPAADEPRYGTGEVSEIISLLVTP